MWDLGVFALLGLLVGVRRSRALQGAALGIILASAASLMGLLLRHPDPGAVAGPGRRVRRP